MSEGAARFAVGTNRGEFYFKNIDDAAMAIAMLNPYHNLKIEAREVRRALEFHERSEKYPL